MERDGWTCAVVERWNSFAKVRQDLFGFIDLVAIKADQPGVLAIQACADNGGGVSDHIKKLTSVLSDEKPERGESRVRNVKEWLAAGNKLDVMGWGKRGERGKRKVWTLRRVPITLETFSANGNATSNP